MTSCVPHHLVFPGEPEDGKAHFGEGGGQAGGESKVLSGETSSEWPQGQPGICPCVVRKTRWRET